MPFRSRLGSNVPLTVALVPAANCVKMVDALAGYSRIQLDRLGLVTAPVTVVGAVTSAPSVGLVMVTTGAEPMTGPSTRNPLFDNEACSTPVCTVTGVRKPTAAAASMAICAVAVVGPVTLMGPNPPAKAPPTEIPAPKLACETPCWKFVAVP